MDNEKYNQVIDEAYENYANDIQAQRKLRQNQNKIIEKIISIERIISQKECVRVLPVQLLSREEFINVCKIDPELCKAWDLKIEERELSLEERTNLLKDRSDNKKDFYDRNSKLIIEEKYVLDESNIPTKLITITYNNETIESYE